MTSGARLSGETRPIVGVVLAGGTSSRMGRPKHAIVIDGVSLLERVRGVLTRCCERVVVSGPDALGTEASPAIVDPADLYGPLAGIVGVRRCEPAATLVVAACDLPALSESAVEWLLGHRAADVWGVVPTQRGRAQPQLALWEPELRETLERLARAGRGPRVLVDHDRVLTPEVPPLLASAWHDLDTPAALEAWRRRRDAVE